MAKSRIWTQLRLDLDPPQLIVRQSGNGMSGGGLHREILDPVALKANPVATLEAALDKVHNAVGRRAVGMKLADRGK